VEKVCWQVADVIQQPGLPYTNVLATMMRLLNTTLIRVGNEEYIQSIHFGDTGEEKRRPGNQGSD